ncbi:MAG TPA: histidine kinase dimerization/phospho-acceptor domain-containing protein [Sphingomicrobium sp.]|nr:histidine kinase dimerization/phospho-acceptor domain-containing protein [Sphingomicrobium sp.]
MRFDDRLLTVLNQPAGDRHDVAVRWRQLVDLVARAGTNATSPTVGEALESIRSDARQVDENLRAAAARAVAALPLPLGLLEYFASDELAVSAPVLAAATLEPWQWQSILGSANDETRRFVETLHPELRPETAPSEERDEHEAPHKDRFSEDEFTDELVEEPVIEPEPVPIPVDEPLPATPAPSLHEVVQRIERRRRSRAMMRRGGLAPALPTSTSLFRWECGAGGEIAWVEGAPRGALIGRSIARARNGDGDHVDPEVVRAFSVRAPFRDAALTVAGDGLVSGEWKISGVPAFDPADGRFRGYRGVALREQPESQVVEEEATQALADPDSLRELVHEIKTPLNAIIGFAEIIEGQYLGPADRRYRERAQEIVRQARLLLTAIDDLDFAAKVHSSAGTAHARVNLGDLVERIIPTLAETSIKRGVEVSGTRSPKDATAAIEPELADRLIFRMCNALIDQAGAGERLRLSVDRSGERWRVSMTRPARLAAMTEEQLLGSEGDAGQGFSLRLVQGLARIAGADLVAPHGTISLLFPRG